MSVEVKTNIKFKPWRAPNYAIIESSNSTEGHPMPVKELDEAALEAMAMSWLEDLYSDTNYECPFQSRRVGAP